MRHLKIIALLLVVSLGAAQASSLNRMVSPALVNINVSHVEADGMVLSSRKATPYEHLLIGIPATINTGSACTSFAGQRYQDTKSFGILEVLGATDPINDVCIAVMPDPVETILTVPLRIGPAFATIARKLVRIDGKFYDVVVELATDKVTVTPQAN